MCVRRYGCMFAYPWHKSRRSFKPCFRASNPVPHMWYKPHLKYNSKLQNYMSSWYIMWNAILNNLTTIYYIKHEVKKVKHYFLSWKRVLFKQHKKMRNVISLIFDVDTNTIFKQYPSSSSEYETNRRKDTFLLSSVQCVNFVKNKPYVQTVNTGLPTMKTGTNILNERL